ncbi:hypothetical protein FNV43_RR14899 [Rhamnella rubrinervis]|uniref:Uncharacterized protein n=1 Tax=Rhamnella rubrinervis TaxID=2594499 RepID=A0A8K0MGT9_9ROSA|nr:hypothetical protein FNV43_RR14899 [Rhamnella rubrinervis]
MAARPSTSLLLIVLSLLLLVAFSDMAENALGSAKVVARIQVTRSHACSSAKSAVDHVVVFLLAPMETKVFAVATTAGRPRKEDPNALESFRIYFHH